MQRPIFALFLAGVLGAAWSATAQVSLVRGGQVRAAVITADEATPTAAYAAEELVRHVALATGCTLPVVKESETPEAPHTRVYIGETRAARKEGIDTDRLPREAYVIRSVGNDLFILGERRRRRSAFAEQSQRGNALRRLRVY